MPENETLLYDARSASRWRPISEKLDNGLSTNDAFPTIQDNFYGQLLSVWSRWRHRDVDAADLFKAALEDPNRLRDLIRQTNFDPNAQMLRDVARSLENPEMERLIRAFLDAAWESAQAQLRLDCREDSPSPEFMDQIQGMLDRIRRCLLKNLSRFPSRIRREPPPDMGTRLGEKLL
jgi:hypothetical protein